MAAWMDANITNVTLDEWLALHDRLRDEANALAAKAEAEAASE